MTHHVVHGRSKSRPSSPAIAFSSMTIAIALAFGLPGTQAHAQETAVSISIAAKPLGQALLQLGTQTSLQIFYPQNIVEGLQAPAISGNLTPEQALQQLLQNTAITYERQGNNVTLSRKSASNEAELGLVTVKGGNPATTEGTGSYTTRATGAATRMELSLRETPQSVSVIGRQQIEDQNLTTLAEVLRQTPGIVVDRLDERQKFTARGFELSPMIDGVPTLAYNTNSGEASMISTTIYDRVEVIRGAAGLLNGVGSPGGAINLVRKRPTAEFSGHVSAGVGTWSRYNAEADLSTKLNESGSVRGRVVASHTQGNSFIDAKKQKEDIFYGIVEADLTAQTRLAAGVEYQETAINGASFGQLPLFYKDGTRPDLPRSFNSSTPWSEWNMKTQRAFVNLEHRAANNWLFKADVSYTKNDRERFSGDIWLDWADIDPVTHMGRVQLANNPANSINKALDVYATGPFQLFGQTHQATVGFNINKYSYSYGNDSAALNAFDRRPANIFDLGAIAKPDFNNPLNRYFGETEEKAVYGSVRLKPVEPLAIIIGGRMTWYETVQSNRIWSNGTNGRLNPGKPTTANDVFTPYFGVVYDITKQYSVYASYTDIFQPNTTRDANGEILDPKRGTNMELGVKGEHLDGRVNSSFAIFKTQEDNLSEAVPGVRQPDGTQAYRAVMGAQSRGFEATVSGEVTRGLQLMAGYTYNAKYSNKDVLLNTTYPRRIARVAAQYRLPGNLSKLTIGGNVSYQSNMYYDYAENATIRYRAAQGGLTLIGIMARYDFTPQLSASLNIENLTDKNYYSGLGGYSGYTYGNPRNAWLKMNYKF